MSRRRLDNELLAATAAGDGQAFHDFYIRYKDLVLAYALRRIRDPELAAEITAETFAGALWSVHRGNANNVSAPGAWLLTIARNKLIDARRRGRVESAARRRLGMGSLILEDADIERILETSDEGAIAMRLARELPEDQWLALEARVLDDEPFAEVAKSLGVPEYVARKRVARALTRLRRAFEERVR